MSIQEVQNIIVDVHKYNSAYSSQWVKMFDKLQQEIDTHNQACSGSAGKAKLQVFEWVQDPESESSGNESDPTVFHTKRVENWFLDT